MNWEFFWQWLDRVEMLSVAGAAGLAVFKPQVLRRWFTRNRFPSVGSAALDKADAIVFTVSKAETPAWVMAQLKPKAVAFIATELSLPVAEELRQQAIKLGITALEPVLLADPDNPALCRKLTAELLVELADHGRLAVDVTGGRTPMSLGAFMAAEELGAGTLYVSCQYPNGKPDMASAAIVCISTPT